MKQSEKDMQSEHPNKVRPEVAAGLPGSPPILKKYLRKAGIEPDRLSILHLGRPPNLLKYKNPPWARRMILGYALWLALFVLDLYQIELPAYLDAAFSLATGLIIIQVA
jgi:hypothetical protein